MELDWGGIIFTAMLMLIGAAGMAFWLWDWFRGRKIPSGMDGRSGPPHG